MYFVSGNIIFVISSQVKEKDTSTPLLGGKDGHQDKEDHESKKLSKDSLV